MAEHNSTPVPTTTPIPKDAGDFLSSDEVTGLRAAIDAAEAGDVSKPLPRLTKAQLFIIGVMSSIDPNFAQNIGGPLLRRDAGVPEKEREAEENRRERKIDRAKTKVDLARLEASEKRADAAADAATAREGRAATTFTREEEERTEQKKILKDSIEGEMGNFALSRENALSRGEELVRTAEATGVPSLIRMANSRLDLIRSEFGEMEALMEGAIDQGPDGGFFEIPDTDVFLANLQENAERVQGILDETEQLILETGVRADAARAAAAAAGGDDIPASIKEKLADLDTVNLSLDALEQFQIDFPDVGGPGGQAVGFFQETIGRIFDTKENFDTKNGLVAEVGTTLIKMKSGSQVTESEFERIKPMLPAINLTDAENRNRIKNLRRFLANNISAIEARFSIIDALPSDVVRDMSPEEKDALFSRNESTRFKGWAVIEIPEGMVVEATFDDSQLSGAQGPTGAGAVVPLSPGEASFEATRARQKALAEAGGRFVRRSLEAFSPLEARVPRPEDTITLKEAGIRRKRAKAFVLRKNKKKEQ